MLVYCRAVRFSNECIDTAMGSCSPEQQNITDVLLHQSFTAMKESMKEKLCQGQSCKTRNVSCHLNLHFWRSSYFAAIYFCCFAFLIIWGPINQIIKETLYMVFKMKVFLCLKKKKYLEKCSICTSFHVAISWLCKIKDTQNQWFYSTLFHRFLQY